MREDGSRKPATDATVQYWQYLTLTRSITIADWILQPNLRLYSTSEPSVSITDWLNSQGTDRLISAVLIGYPPRQTGATYRPPTPQNNPPAPSFRHTRHYIQRTHRCTFNAQYMLPYNVHAQQSNLGNTRSPVTGVWFNKIVSKRHSLSIHQQRAFHLDSICMRTMTSCDSQIRTYQ